MIACAAFALTAACSSTPVPLSYVNHFDSAREDREHGKCMSDNAMFNTRQLFVAPNAVESAWSYCVRQADVWYPGSDKGVNSGLTWTGKQAAR